MRLVVFGLLVICGQQVVFSQNVNIPDPNFRAFCLSRYDQNDDGEISYAEAAQIELMDCSHQGIADLTGIEAFINLSLLDCSRNLLVFLPDLSGMSLTRLWCRRNDLIVLPDLPSTLEVFHCDDNELTWLPDLSQMNNLREIGCTLNSLTSLPDLSGFNNLESLAFTYNHLTSVPELPSGLQDLYCWNNWLDESSCDALDGFDPWQSNYTQGNNVSLDEQFVAWPRSNWMIDMISYCMTGVCQTYTLDCGQ